MNKERKQKALISVVMPAYNCAKFIRAALDSVLGQTYENWEIVIVDDCSTDNTADVIAEYTNKDKRIKYYKLAENSGPAVARNTAVDLANGNYLAFLDSDDLWFPDKLEKQIAFMEENGYSFTCTSYTKIDEQGAYLGKTIIADAVREYDSLLKKNAGNSTVMYNADIIGKIKIPDIRKRNDYLMWLKVIKIAGCIYGIQEPLGSYRVRKDSISGNKFKLIKYHWKVYREFEKLPFFKSCRLVVYWAFATVLKLR